MANTAATDDSGSEYWPIHIARSDGQGYSRLDNQELSASEDQDVTQLERWEVIVAGHLQNQIGPKDDKRQYKLAEFPKGYELRCAVRKDGGRDYYLYGHPAGPKATYRTPGEFALHALWLVSDSTDNNQCSCDLCPKYLEKARSIRERSLPLAAPSLPATSSPASVPQQQQLQQPQQLQQHQQPQQSQQPQPQPQPQPQQQQQQLPPPGTTGWTNVFRVGELVWYKHTAWRLGVVLAITPKPGNPVRHGAPDSSFHFTLAPLGHALLEQANLVKDCQSMRPFLTFSVPGASMEELKDKTFPAVNWRVLTARLSQEPDPSKREVNRQVLGLEASKMGARAINDAFSTFDLVAQGTAPDGSVRIQSYGGVYLGAEMVRVGDPVRVTAQAQSDPASGPSSASASGADADATVVMLVTEIQVLTPAAPAGARAALQFKGNLYRAARSPAAQPPPPGAVAGEALGPAFAEELAARGAIDRDAGMRWSWVLVAAQVVRAEQDVQGRFYVTARLMSVIDPARYQGWVQRGVVEEAPAYLNNRAHSGGGAFTGRAMGRKGALGEAVSAEFRAPEGMVEN